VHYFCYFDDKCNMKYNNINGILHGWGWKTGLSNPRASGVGGSGVQRVFSL